MPVEVSVRQRRRPIDRSATAALCAKLLTAIGIPERAEVGVVLVSDRVMAGMNLSAMGKRVTTDVLAFPIDERIDPSDPAPCLGDIVVCLDRAFEEGRERGNGPDEEFLTYLAHGFLHLTGHDDLEPVAKRRMFAAQARLVSRFSHLPTGVSW
jgi:probable rRNA maturation factor